MRLHTSSLGMPIQLVTLSARVMFTPKRRRIERPSPGDLKEHIACLTDEISRLSTSAIRSASTTGERATMARPRPRKKPERNAGRQPPLPTPRQPASSSTTRVLSMQLQVGDRLVDETGEWEVTVRPYTSPGGKNVHARVRRMDQPATAEDRTWGAHERIAVKRAG